VAPDTLLTRVECFLRPHGWAAYTATCGHIAQFIAAHQDVFALTSDGRVYRRGAPAPAVQMMITPLAPHVRGLITDMQVLSGVPVAVVQPVDDFGSAPPQGKFGKQGRGNGHAGGGRRRGGGAAGNGGGRGAAVIA
jgi:hypothetical protein